MMCNIRGDVMTLSEIRKYRNVEGYIDLDKVPGFNNKVPEREIRGNENRDKYWYELDDCDILVKGTQDDEIETASHYADLIAAELAKQAGFKVADNDIAIYNGKKGLISRNIIKDKEREELFTLREYVGDQTDSRYTDCTDIEFVEAGLLKRNMPKEAITDMKKFLAFGIFIMATDGHTENISFKQTIADNNKIELADLYDMENTLMLDIDLDSIDKISNDFMKISTLSNIQDPKIVYSDFEENDFDDTVIEGMNPFILALKDSVKKDEVPPLWSSTLDYLCMDPQVCDYVEGTLINLDIGKAIKDVETKICASIPENIKSLAARGFGERMDAIKYELCLDLEIEDAELKHDSVGDDIEV